MNARARRRGLPNIVIIIFLLPLLAIPIVAISGAWAQTRDLPPAVRAADIVAPAQRDGAPRPTNVEQFVAKINTALGAKDRDAFFASVTGAATEPLTLLWNNLDVIGWDGAVVSVQTGMTDPGTGPMYVTLGIAFPFAAATARGSGTADSGLLVTEAFGYTMTLEPGADGLMMSGWEPSGQTNPWDIDELYAASGENVRVVGAAVERGMVDSVVGTAQRSARWVLDDYAAAGQTLHVNGFLMFVTKDQERFDRWFHDTYIEGWDFEVAGLSLLTGRPMEGMPGASAMLASGERTSTSVVSIGPLTFSYDSGADIIAHEFVHVAQEDVAPTPTNQASYGDTRATTEGWAEYEQFKFTAGTPTLPSRSTPSGQTISWAARTCFTGAVPTEAQLTGSDATCNYVLSATLYGYAQASGYDVHELSRLAKTLETDPLTASTSMGTGLAPLTPDGWGAWLTSSY